MAVQYLYDCPTCGESVAVTTTQAGQTIPCPSCESSVTLPKLGEIRQLPLAGGEATAKPARSRRKSGSPVKSWLFSGGLLLAVVAGIAAFALQRHASSLYVDINLEEKIQEDKDLLDTASPAQIYAIAVEAGKDSFQLEYKEPPYRSLNIQAGILQNIAWGIWALTAVGVLLVIASFFARK